MRNTNLPQFSLGSALMMSGLLVLICVLATTGCSTGDKIYASSEVGGSVDSNLASPSNSKPAHSAEIEASSDYSSETLDQESQSFKKKKSRADAESEFMLPLDRSAADPESRKRTGSDQEPEGEDKENLPAEKGMFGKAADLFQSVKDTGSSAASGTGKWVADTVGSAAALGSQSASDTMKWADETYQSLKNQGLTTAENTSQWLSDDWKNMDRWEYAILDFEDKMPAEELQNRLNHLGNDGWECFQISGSRYFFKKPSTSYLRSLPFGDVIKLVPLMQGAGSERR